jgi:hypothetical protein
MTSVLVLLTCLVVLVPKVAAVQLKLAVVQNEAPIRPANDFQLVKQAFFSHVRDRCYDFCDFRRYSAKKLLKTML